MKPVVHAHRVRVHLPSVIGVNLAKLVQQIKPKGGVICIQSGGAAAANHNERMQGIRDTLAGKKSAEAPGDKLTGQNGVVAWIPSRWSRLAGIVQSFSDPSHAEQAQRRAPTPHPEDEVQGEELGAV
jgi:hypothetical protein